MTKLVFVVVAVLGLSSCELLNGGAEVQDEFKIIFSKFQEDANLYGREISTGDLVIRFAEPSEMDPKNAGECRAGKHVLINPTYWNQIDGIYGNAERELLLYHELGHCVLGQDHPKWGDSRGWNTLMNPSLMTWAYAQNREFYVRELFGFQKPVGAPEVSAAACMRLL